MKHLLFDDDIIVNVDDYTQLAWGNKTVYTVIPSSIDDFVLLLKALRLNDYEPNIISDFVITFVV